MMHIGGWFPYWHMWDMWLWPIIIVGVSALIIYFVIKSSKGPKKK